MEEDLRSSGAGLRGFKSHPRHHYVENHWGFVLAMNFTYFGFFHFYFLFLNNLCPSKSQTKSNPASIRTQASASVLATSEIKFANQLSVHGETNLVFDFLNFSLQSCFQLWNKSSENYVCYFSWVNI
jgi:hypothetical protein